MGITESQIQQATGYYKEKDGVEIGYLDFGQQRTLVDAYIHGASKAIELLVEEARKRELGSLEEIEHPYND